MKEYKITCVLLLIAYMGFATNYNVIKFYTAKDTLIVSNNGIIRIDTISKSILFSDSISNKIANFVNDKIESISVSIYDFKGSNWVNCHFINARSSLIDFTKNYLMVFGKIIIIKNVIFYHGRLFAEIAKHFELY